MKMKLYLIRRTDTAVIWQLQLHKDVMLREKGQILNINSIWSSSIGD